MLTAHHKDQFTVIVIIDPLPSTLGVSERTSVFQLQDYAISGTVNGCQQVSELLHGDDVCFVLADVDCEVRQRLVAILGTC